MLIAAKSGWGGRSKFVIQHNFLRGAATFLGEPVRFADTVLKILVYVGLIIYVIYRIYHQT